MMNRRSENNTLLRRPKSKVFDGMAGAFPYIVCVIGCHRKLLIPHLSRSDFECMVCMCVCVCFRVSVSLRLCLSSQTLANINVRMVPCVYFGVYVYLSGSPKSHRNISSKTKTFVHYMAWHGIHTHTIRVNNNIGIYMRYVCAHTFLAE